jgi:hypothetical protein
MEGFDSAAVGKIIGIAPNEVVGPLLAIGATDEPSADSPYPKFRFSVDDVIVKK